MDELKVEVKYVERIKKYQTESKVANIEEMEEFRTSYLDKDSVEIVKGEQEEKEKLFQIIVTKYNQTQTIEIPEKQIPKNRILIKNMSFQRDKLIKTMQIDDKTYYLYINKKGHLAITRNSNDIFHIKTRIYQLATRKNIIFGGIITDTRKNEEPLEEVYLEDNIYGKIRRPFHTSKLRHIAIIKIAIKDIVNLEQIHNKVAIGNKRGDKIELTARKKKKKGMKYYDKRKFQDKLILLRSTLKGKAYIITQVPYEKEYSMICTLKNAVARIIAPLFAYKRINLMFEKETMKANESGWYVFEKIMEYTKKHKSKSHTYFIIDKNSPDYEKAKSKHRKNVIEKYTLKHYIYLYASKYFISSELSNHVINPRLYIRSINQVIAKKPLIFLQHGIMFAKPVDNPAAKGFYKNNTAVNICKSVVCSDLEAEQFYKMGYSNSDLIKTGLPKFDISYLNKDADKIMFMPTYRYWEENLVNNDETISKTTYYQKYVKVIKAFEKHNLLDKLIISGHPKFIKAIAKHLPEYEHLIETDINKGLENAKIFITDFSSASYDAHYRGAYVIYDWSEKDYLIKNYKAVPPINEENCDGVPVYSIEELVEQVEKAIGSNYYMEEKYEKRYQKINEFSDGKNGDRLIEELQKLNII